MASWHQREACHNSRAPQVTLPTSFGNFWWSDKIASLQRSLLHTAHHRQQTAEPGQALPVLFRQACCISASVFVDAYLRNLGLRARIVQVQVGRLQRKLEKILSIYGLQDLHQMRPVTSILNLTPFPEASGHHSDVILSSSNANLRFLLWALVLGGTTTVDNGRANTSGLQRRSWFVSQIARLCAYTHLPSCSDVEDVLSSILWNADWNTSMRSLWQEVAVLLS